MGDEMSSYKWPLTVRCVMCGKVIRAKTQRVLEKRLRQHAKKCFKGR